MTAAPETLRPDFAEELLERLARGRRARSSSPVLRKAVAGAAVAASVAVVAAARRRTR